jgi:hypothetical protein
LHTVAFVHWLQLPRLLHAPSSQTLKQLLMPVQSKELHAMLPLHEKQSGVPLFAKESCWQAPVPPLQERAQAS